MGEALGMSDSGVHQICCRIRKMRRADLGSADFPPILIEHHLEWMEHGRRRDYTAEDWPAVMAAALARIGLPEKS